MISEPDARDEPPWPRYHGCAAGPTIGDAAPYGAGETARRHAYTPRHAARSAADLVAARSFALAARWLSFKRAADELGLAVGAEPSDPDARGAPRRDALPPPQPRHRAHRRRPALPRDGRAGARLLSTAQHDLATRPRELRVSALQSFSESWLVPHLPEFERRHPGIELRIEATLRYADFARDAVDVAIRFGRGPWDGLHAEPIVDLDAFPVCGPALAAATRRSAGRRTSRRTLIHVAQVPDAWRDGCARPAFLTSSRAARSRTTTVGIKLAAGGVGAGVALSTELLCESWWLHDGRSSAGRCRSARSDETYHLVCRPEPRRSAHHGAARPRRGTRAVRCAARKRGCEMSDCRARPRGDDPRMRQLTCVEAGRLEWQEVPEPRIAGDGEAIVRSLAVALRHRPAARRRTLSDERTVRGRTRVRRRFTALGDAVRGSRSGSAWSRSS